MKPASGGAAAHPAFQLLALYATGDLPWPASLRARYHVTRCPDCKAQLSRFRLSLADLKKEAANVTLAESDWGRMEREMLGNIAVGVAAARCIDNIGRKRFLSAGTLVTAGLAALFAVGWFTHIPLAQNVHLVDSLRGMVGMKDASPFITVVQSTPEGIAVRSRGGTLTMLHSSSAIVSSSGSSTVTARYIDEATGQVTVTNVYGE